MHAALIILAMSGSPDCDSWLKRFFLIECATLSRRPHILERSEGEIRHHDDGDAGGDTPGGDSGGDSGGHPKPGDGGQPPDTPTTPPDNGGGPPTTGDRNRGHGNDAGKHDPDNPGRGKGKNR